MEVLRRNHGRDQEIVSIEYQWLLGNVGDHDYSSDRTQELCFVAPL